MVGLPSLALSRRWQPACISRAKFDDVDDCAIEIIVACLHVGVPIVSLLCTHCVRMQTESGAQQHTLAHRERDTHRVSIQLCRSAAELCMPQINSTTERVHKRHSHKTRTTRRCVCCLENTHLVSLPLFSRLFRC
jgi:hypothetical protein